MNFGHLFKKKKQKHCQMNELTEGYCWIGMTQASSSGLILAARVGKHTDQFIEEQIVNTEGQTNCRQWHPDDWGGYERILPPFVEHIIGKDKTQQLERTNGIVRQQTGIGIADRINLVKPGSKLR